MLQMHVNQSRAKEMKKGVATCTQHYCWGTQQIVKWRNCPSSIILPEEVFFRKLFGKPFSGNFPEKLLPEEEFVTSGSTHKLLPEERHPECFRKNLLPEVSGKSFFRKLAFFLKKIYFVIIYF